MENKNIILVAIAVIVVILIAIGVSSFTGGDANVTNVTENNTTDFIDADSITANDSETNNTTVGDNSTFIPPSNLTNNNTPYKVYNPQTDSYVPVIGEAFDEEVNRWYTYDEDGVRYYNTRINQ